MKEEMKKKNVLVIENIECENLGSIKKFLQDDKFNITVINPQKLKIPDISEFSHLIILGGPMSVYDNLSYLNYEQELIRFAIKKNIPTLGICLGAQLIAQSMGGMVFKGHKKEIGWFDICITKEGVSDIFRGIEKEQLKIFQWHGDTFSLPENAILLAESEHYPQAFRIGSAIGIQFHVEVTKEMINIWKQIYQNEIRDENFRDETKSSKYTKELFYICFMTW